MRSFDLPRGPFENQGNEENKQRNQQLNQREIRSDFFMLRICRLKIVYILFDVLHLAREV